MPTCHKTNGLLMAFILLFIVSILPARLLAANATPGGLLHYTDQAEFETAYPGLPVEDFEESTVADNGAKFFPRPLNSVTDIAGAFARGDILPGLTITSSGNAAFAQELLVTGGNRPGHGFTSKAVANGNFFNLFTIEFPDTVVYAVGMDLMWYTPVTADAEIKIYGAAGLLDTLVLPLSGTATFVGLYSSQPIASITITKTPVVDNSVTVDNIQFGGALTFYADQNAFATAHPGLPVEDFEESPIAPGATQEFPEPLDSQTDAPGAFVPGDIVDGMEIKTLATITPDTALRVLGEDYRTEMHNASKMVCTSLNTDTLQLRFPGFTAYSVGMDLMPWQPFFRPAVPALISVYGVKNNLLGTKTLTLQSGTETFLGIHSNHLIKRILISITNLGECVDNIQFGGTPEGLIFYTGEPDFRKNRQNLPTEDFAESTIANAALQQCDAPIDSSTDQENCFRPGDILPNISFQTVASKGADCPGCMFLLGRNHATYNSSKPLLTAVHPQTLEVSFTENNVYLAGMDLYGSQSTLLSLYDTKGTFLGDTVSLATTDVRFFGVKSTKPIGRIETWGGVAIIGDVQFGSKFPWPAFMAAITGLGSAAPQPSPPASTPFSISSSSFNNNQAIPVQYTLYGANTSPQLSWVNAPTGTASFMLTVLDPDGGDWLHWQLKLPASATSLAENAGASGGANLPAGSIRYDNDFKGLNIAGAAGTDYDGPRPPAGSGVHHYNFKVTALDAGDNELGSVTLTGTYEQP